VIGLDGGSTSSKAVLVDEEGEIVCKAYQLSKGNPIQDTKELLAQLKAHVTSQGATLEVLGFGATGYAADVLQECAARRRQHRRDRRAHDVGGEVLRRRRRHLRHRRAGHQGPVHEERRHRQLPAVELVLGRQRHAAAGDGRSVRPQARHRVRRDRVRGRSSRPSSAYGCAVFLDTDRVNFQKEGYSKEELLAGLAQVLPKNVWQYVVQIPRLASLGTRSCCRAARSTTSRRSRRRSTTSRSACPGRRGVRAPAHGRGRRDRRGVRDAARGQAPRPLDASSGLDAAIDLEFTTKNDERRSVTSARTSASARSSTRSTPTARRRYISGFSCEKGTVESEDAMLALVAERKKIAKQYPNLVDYEQRSWRSAASTSRAPMPADGHARSRGDVRDVKKGWTPPRHRRVEVERAPSSARGPECARAPAQDAHRHPPRAQHPLDGAVLPHLLRGARGAEAERRLQRARPPRRCGSRAASTARSTRASRRRWRRRTSTTCCFTTTRPDEKPLKLHLLPHAHARAELPRRRDGQGERAPSSPACPT
jgi:hypothetical protein